jgi:fructokinase
VQSSAVKRPIDVLVIGEALVDIVHTSGGDVEHPGGSPANVALGLGRLGVDVALLSDIGRDERGDRIARHLEESSVQVLASSFSNRATSSATAVIADDGSAEYLFDVRWDPRPDPGVRPRIVHTGSIAAFMEPGCRLVAELIRTTDASEITFDPNIRPALLGDQAEALEVFEQLASFATAVKMSDEDAAWLYPATAPLQVLERVRTLGPRLVALTMGASGSLLSCGDAVVEVPTVAVDVVDTIGAGDTYMASLIASLVEYPSASITRSQLHLIGTRAARAAAITVSRAGADLPNRDDIARFDR